MQPPATHSATRTPESGVFAGVGAHKTCHGQAAAYRRLVQFPSSFLRKILRIFAGLGSLVRFGAACFATHSATLRQSSGPC